MQTLLLLLGLFVLMACFGVVLYSSHQRLGRLFGGTPEEKARDELVGLCSGDEEAAERLRQREMERSPNISSREAYRRAVRRCRRHNQ
jgi:hypothetical protein